MPRQSRILLPNNPHHIMQRGHNRQVIFASDDDFLYYKENLIEFKQQFGCEVYAYCLMTNHVHLVINPGENPEALSLLMKRVAGRQTRYINAMEKRTGSLWEGRYKSSIISNEEYLLTCCRYIELNPLRAGMVEAVGDCRWSSYNCKANGEIDKLVDLDSQYLGLGRSDAERQEAYRKYMSESISDLELKLIREAVQRNQVTGSERFREEIARKHGVRISNRGQGRPRKVVG